MIEKENITLPLDSIKEYFRMVFRSSGLFMPLPKYSAAVNSGKIVLIENDSFVKHMPAILNGRDDIHRLRDEFLEINFSGPLWEIKEEYWEVYQPFENTDNSSPDSDEKYLEYVSRPEVIARIKGSVILRENITSRMERIRNRLNSIVDNFESQYEIDEVNITQNNRYHEPSNKLGGFFIP